MLLGARRSGRIYGTVEQSALRVLCGQLAVAIENAQLFTEVQNAKIYNETLLQNLTTGVVAADRNGLVTVFNREVEQITRLDCFRAPGAQDQQPAGSAARHSQRNVRWGRAARGSRDRAPGRGQEHHPARQQLDFPWTGWRLRSAR
jgi:hypothetical protein